MSIVESPKTGRFALNQEPGEIATILLEAMDATAEQRSAPNPASWSLQQFEQVAGWGGSPNQLRFEYARNSWPASDVLGA